MLADGGWDGRLGHLQILPKMITSLLLLFHAFYGNFVKIFYKYTSTEKNKICVYKTPGSACSAG